MTDNNHKNTNCAFNRDIIAYLYNEISYEKRNDFEFHLSDCSTCADEYAGLVFARNAVADWRDEEFALTAPPLIAVNYKPTIETHEVVENVSWIGNLKLFFTAAPLINSFGFAAILFIVAGFVYFYSIDKTVEVASENKNPVKAVNSKTSDRPDESRKLESAGKVEKYPSTTLVETARRKSSEPASVEVSDIKPANKPQIASRAGKMAAVNKARNQKNELKASNQTAIIAAKNSQIPKLSNFDEVEDNSLRLADLMAEVEDK